jgi:hypothetical protein
MSWCCCPFFGSASAPKSNVPLVRWSNLKGPETQVSNFSLQGKGTALCNAVLLQTRCYFEIKVLALGDFCVGVAAQNKTNLQKHLRERKDSWFFSSADNKTLEVGDVIGITYDLSEVRPALTFYLNGTEIPGSQRTDIRGDVVAAASVSDGAHLEANFGQLNFAHPPPSGFGAIIFSMDII